MAWQTNTPTWDLKRLESPCLTFILAGKMLYISNFFALSHFSHRIQVKRRSYFPQVCQIKKRSICLCFNFCTKVSKVKEHQKMPLTRYTEPKYYKCLNLTTDLSLNSILPLITLKSTNFETFITKMHLSMHSKLKLCKSIQLKLPFKKRL